MKNNDNKKIVNILHLSDMHFGIMDDERKDLQYKTYRTTALKKFFEDFYKIDEDWIPNIIAITGDVGWKGLKTDYYKECEDVNFESFDSFLNKLLDITNVELNNIICCAGNHDKYVARDAIDFDRLLDDDKHFTGLAGYFESFNTYLKNKNIPPLNLKDSSQEQFLYGYREVNGIIFIVLNSAWLCDYRRETDENHLKIGIDIFKKVFYPIKDSCADSVVITMFHHPFDWLNIQERESTERSLRELIVNHSDLVLHGHRHNESQMNINDCIIRETGPLSSDDLSATYHPRCNIIRLNIEQKTLQVGRYEYINAHETANNDSYWEWSIEKYYKQPHLLHKEQLEKERLEKEFYKSLLKLLCVINDEKLREQDYDDVIEFIKNQFSVQYNMVVSYIDKEIHTNSQVSELFSNFDILLDELIKRIIIDVLKDTKRSDICNYVLTLKKN